MNEPKIYNGISFVPKGNVIQMFDAYTGQYYGSQTFDSFRYCFRKYFEKENKQNEQTKTQSKLLQ